MFWRFDVNKLSLVQVMLELTYGVEFINIYLQRFKSQHNSRMTVELSNIFIHKYDSYWPVSGVNDGFLMSS